MLPGWGRWGQSLREELENPRACPGSSRAGSARSVRSPQLCRALVSSAVGGEPVSS